MKKSGLWGRIGVVAILAMILVLSLLTLTSCNEKLEIESFEVVSDTVPGVAVVDEFDISQISLTLLLADGTTQKIAAERSMLTAESREALKTPGQKSITLYYLQKTTVVSVFLVDTDTETVNVTFLDKDGALLAKKYAIKGGAIVAPTAPTEQGKIFSGWVSSSDGTTLDLASIKATTIVYAAYSENLASYTVTFIDYKGNVLSTSTVTHGSKIAPPSFNKPAELKDYDWGINFSTYTITQSQTFEMSYEYATKTVTYFYTYDNNSNINYQLLDGNGKPFYENVIINTPIKNKATARNYLLDQGGVALSFVRWQDDPTSVATDTKLVAVVEPREYTIKYEDGFHSDESVVVGSTYTLQTSAKDKTGYTFNNRWLDVTSGVEVSGAIVISANMLLRPLYTVNKVKTKYIVTFSGMIDSSTGEDTVSVVSLDDALYGSIVDITSITNDIMPQLNASSYHVDTITYGTDDITSQGITLTENAGDAVHEFYIVAVDSSLPTKGLNFTLVGENYTVSSYTGTAVNIYIPATYKGLTDEEARDITAIGANVFEGKTVNINIPSTVTKIGTEAFKNATFLGDFTLPNISELGIDVFRGAKTNNNIKIKITIAGDLTAIPDFAFYATKNITEVVLPSTVVTIGVSAFQLSDITTMNLSNVTSLSNNAFYQSKLANITSLAVVESVGELALAATAITTLDMPKLSTIGKYAFASMAKLTALSIGTALSLEEGQEKTFDLSCIDNSINILTITIGEGFNKLFFDESDFTNIEFVTATINLPASWTLCEKIVDAEVEGVTDEAYIIGVLFRYIQNINVASGNTLYSSVNGVLYKLNDTTASLLLYPGNRNGDYTIPATVDGKSVTEVDTYAFTIAFINNLTMGENVVLETLPILVYQMRIMSVIVDANSLGADAGAPIAFLADAFFHNTNIYVNGTVEDFANIVSTNGWTNVFMLSESGAYSVYDAASDLVYSVKGNKATVIYGNMRAEQITVPAKFGNIDVNEIEDGAFAYYQYLETLTINATLKSFNNDILYNCINLANITIAGWEANAQVSITAFEDTKFFSSKNIILLGGKLIGYNNAATTVDENDDIVPLTTVSAEDLAGVIVIPDNFFKNSNLSSIVLPSTVKNMGKYAFQNCLSLKEINLNEVTIISEGAFAGSGLTRINLVNVVELKANAFKGCESLVRADIPKKVNNGSLLYGTFEDCIALTIVEMPFVDRLSVDEYNLSRAFANCISLKNISFIAHLASIPGEAFSGCTSIVAVDFTTSPAISIGAGAFKDCTSLIYLVISATIKDLGVFAFSGCENLETIRIVGTRGILSATTPWALDIFPNTSNIYVHIDASRAALSNYSDQIETVLPYVDFAMMDNFGANAPLNMDKVQNVSYMDTEPQATAFAGYIFDGWYRLMGMTYAKITFPLLVTENIILYAKYYSETKGSLSDEDVEYDAQLGGWKVIKFTNTSADSIFIPSTYTKKINGVDSNYPIVLIYAGAFTDCTNLKSITIPEGVKTLSIGGYFANGVANINGVFNNGLTYIYLPSSLETIEGNLFTDIAALDIEFGANCKLHMASTSAFTGTQWYDAEETKALRGINNGFILAGRLAIEYVLQDSDIVIVPSEVIKLNDMLFAGNQVIEEIRLNDNLMYIGIDCFTNAINLQYVRYASGDYSADSKIKELNLNAFAGTKWLANQNMVIVGTILSKYYDFNGKDIEDLPDFITEISANAFENVTISTLNIGANSRLKVIGDYAFKNSGLTSINLPATVTTLGKGVFQDCSMLTEVNLFRTDITYLAEDLLSGCSYLKTLTLSDKVNEFKKASLNGCVSLKNITANGLSVTKNLNNVINEGGSGLNQTSWYALPSTGEAQYLTLGKVLVKYIPSNIVNEDDDEIIATIPNGVETILSRVFEESGITKVIIATSVKFIEVSAFYRCYYLEEIVFGSGSLLTTIGESAFQDCIKLSKVTSASLPNPQDTVWTNTLPSSLKTISANAFRNTALTNVTIPDSVVHLGASSFSEMDNLERVRIGSGVMELGRKVFYDCENLYKVEWTASEEQLNDISDYIESAITAYDTTKYRTYIEELFKRTIIGNSIRIYMDSSSYNFIVNSNPNLEGATDRVKQINAWATSPSFGLFMVGEYPEVTFENDGYYMQSFKSESIETIGTPAKTGNTFVGWYLDALMTMPLDLSEPYNVYHSITLYAKWYTNNLFDATSDSNLNITENTVTNVYGTESELFIPTTAANKAITSIVLAENAESVTKLVLTNASNFNGMTSNIFRYFPNLEQLVLLNGGTVGTEYKIVDGVVYSLDGSKLIAYIARFTLGTSPKVRETSFTVPLGVTEIADYAFVNSGLTEIRINSNVAKIGYHAFNNSLTTILFHKDINITNADRTSFENTAWYQNEADTASTVFETNWVLSSSAKTNNGGIGFFYSAGNILLEYDEGVKVNNFVIPDVLKRFNITTLGSYINNASRNEENVLLMSFTHLKLPINLVKINSYAFKDIDITTNIEAGTALIDIADNVFNDTDFYRNNSDAIILGKVLVKWINTEQNIILPNYIVAISNNAFNSSQIVTIVLPETLKTIGDEAFYSCNKLREIVIPINVTSIGKNAFASNTSLTSVSFNVNTSKLTTIGDNAFNNCTALTSIAIPHGVLSIGNEVFLNCKALKTVTFDYIVTVEDPVTGAITVNSSASKLSLLNSIGSGAFYNCEALSEISIPKNITIINEETFYNCKALVNVNFDTNKSMLKIIAARAFYNCVKLGSKLTLGQTSNNKSMPTDLTTVILPNKLEIIREHAFENCSGMFGIQLNYNVTRIESNVFYGCVKLAKVSIYSASPATILANAFTRSTLTVTAHYKLRIYVNTSINSATKRLYQRAWTAYSNQIFQREELPVLQYSRVATGVGGSTQTVYSDPISTDVIVNPAYTWGATEYSTWSYTSLSTIMLNGETFLPEKDPETNEVRWESSTTDPRLDKELGTENYQKYVQDGTTYILLILDFDKTVLIA